MTEKAYGEFIANLIYTLNKNGYPKNAVSLSMDKMYGLAHEKGLNFNKVLSFLEEKGIRHEKKSGKVIFRAHEPESPSTHEDPAADHLSGFANFNFESLKDLDIAGMMSGAQEMLKNMSPEDLARIQDMYANMTDEQKRDLMEKARSLGLL